MSNCKDNFLQHWRSERNLRSHLLCLLVAVRGSGPLSLLLLTMVAADISEACYNGPPQRTLFESYKPMLMRSVVITFVISEWIESPDVMWLAHSYIARSTSQRKIPDLLSLSSLLILLCNIVWVWTMLKVISITGRWVAWVTCHPPGGCHWLADTVGVIPWWMKLTVLMAGTLHFGGGCANSRASGPSGPTDRTTFKLLKSLLSLGTCSPTELLRTRLPSPSCTLTLPKPINICCLGQKYCAVTLLSQPLLKKSLVN